MNVIVQSGAAYLLLNKQGLPVAGERLTLAEVGPFIARAHEAFEHAETAYTVWEQNNQRFLGLPIGEGLLVLKCGSAMPLTKAVYLLDEIARTCRGMMP